VLDCAALLIASENMPKVGIVAIEVSSQLSRHWGIGFGEALLGVQPLRRRLDEYCNICG